MADIHQARAITMRSPDALSSRIYDAPVILSPVFGREARARARTN